MRRMPLPVYLLHGRRSCCDSEGPKMVKKGQVIKYRDCYRIPLQDSKIDYFPEGALQFSVPYRTIRDNSMLFLTLVTSRSKKRKPIELLIRTSALGRAELGEACRLEWHVGRGDRGKWTKEMRQPVGVWRYADGLVVAACLKKTKKSLPLERWLLESKKGEDPDLSRRLLLGLEKPIVEAGEGVFGPRGILYARKQEKPLVPASTLYPFRGMEQEVDARPRASGGVMLHVKRRPEGHFSARTVTAPHETGAGSRTQLSLNERTALHRLGYKITGTSRSKRWRVLTEHAVPKLGLKEVARTIASHVRRTKSQRGGEDRYAHAIGEWMHDLARLKREIYPKYRSQFPWPL